VGTRLSSHFRERRLELGLRPGHVARLLGFKSLVGCANQIIRFEERGEIRWDLFVRLAKVLGIHGETVERLMDQDRRENLEEWSKRANEPFRPFLLIKYLTGVSAELDLPDEALNNQESMEAFASSLAELRGKAVALVLSHRISVFFGDDGKKLCTHEAAPGDPPGAAMRLSGSTKLFRFNAGADGQALRPLVQPTPPSIKPKSADE